MRAQIPAQIATAAVAVLQPYCPELSPAGLIEALKSRNATPKTTTIKPMTRRQAADVLQVSVCTVARYIKSGVLRASKIGKRLVRIDPTSVAALLQTQTIPTDAPEA